MSDLNPYISPASAMPVVDYHAQELYRRVGNDLIVWDGVVLPPRCIKTNQPIGPGDVKKTKKLVYTPSWVWVFILAGVLTAVILSAIVSKRVNVTYSLSRAQANRYRNRIIVGLILTFGGLGIMLLPAFVHLVDAQNGIAILGGLVTFLSGLITLTQVNPIRTTNFNNGWFTIKGCSKEFLDSIAPM